VILVNLSKNEIRAHLKAKWKKQGECGVCGKNSWIVVDDLYCLPDINDQKSFPVGIVVCEYCGACVFLSAEVIRKEHTV
jgi:hypothetical protein